MSDDARHRLLPRHLLGELSGAEVQEFERHLAECEECRAEKSFLEEVQAEAERHGDALFSDHPEAEELVGFVSGELDQSRAASIKAHLDLCVTCAAELRFVTGTGSVQAQPLATAEAPRANVPARFWIGAAAAVLIAFSLPFTLNGDDPSSRKVRAQLITGVERGDAPESVLTLGRSEAQLDAYLPVDVAAEAFPVDLVVESSTGRVVHRERYEARAELVQELYAFFSCSRNACGPGDYVARITDKDGRAERLAFRVVVQDRR